MHRAGLNDALEQARHDADRSDGGGEATRTIDLALALFPSALPFSPARPL
jgi:hypothetical protein